MYCIWSLSVLPLQNIRKRTAEGDEQHSSLSSIIKAVELSISKWTTLILNEWDSCILCFEIQTLALVKTLFKIFDLLSWWFFAEELEGKVKSVANYERLQELQSSLVWPSITELDPKAFIPEVNNLFNVVLFKKLTLNSRCVSKQEATFVKNRQELVRCMNKAVRELQEYQLFLCSLLSAVSKRHLGQTTLWESSSKSQKTIAVRGFSNATR